MLGCGLGARGFGNSPALLDASAPCSELPHKRLPALTVDLPGHVRPRGRVHAVGGDGCTVGQVRGIQAVGCRGWEVESH